MIIVSITSSSSWFVSISSLRCLASLCFICVLRVSFVRDARLIVVALSLEFQSDLITPSTSPLLQSYHGSSWQSEAVRGSSWFMATCGWFSVARRGSPCPSAGGGVAFSVLLFVCVFLVWEFKIWLHIIIYRGISFALSQNACCS